MIDLHGALNPSQCALAKLSYLLSKPLSSDQIRHLLGISLRGEISSPSTASTRPPAADDLERLNGLLVQAVDLTGGRALLDLHHQRGETGPDGPDEVAAWGRSENASHLLEAAILPQLLFKSVAAPSSPVTLRSLLDTYAPHSPATSSGAVAGPTSADDPACANVVNALNSVGMSLLHVACVHGSTECVQILLERGGSVHVRDMLGYVFTFASFAPLLSGV